MNSIISYADSFPQVICCFCKAPVVCSDRQSTVVFTFHE